jgi:hypothetical protein
MFTRRMFLTKATATLVMVPLACSMAADPASGPGDAGTPAPDGDVCDGVLTTSTNVSQHTHTLCVPESDLTSPPPNGATYTSSNVNDPLNNVFHTHTVDLTAQQLSTINGGGQVVVTASTSDFHNHQLMIMRGA